jgi:hypothetical protein
MSRGARMRWTGVVDERPTISDLGLNPGRRARQSLEAGATGLILGRNIWQREHDESLRLISKLQEILVKHPSCSIAS